MNETKHFLNKQRTCKFQAATKWCKKKNIGITLQSTYEWDNYTDPQKHHELAVNIMSERSKFYV